MRISFRLSTFCLLIALQTASVHSLMAQDTGFYRSFSDSLTNDSLTVFDLERFLEIVKDNHPVALQADLLRNEADATMLRARGGFEPKLYGDLAEKDFKDANYYNLLDAGLAVPTWLGIDIKAGLERGRGSYVNPQNETPDNGLLFAGITVPVGQGLFIDKRRADLRKARIFMESNQVMQISMLNELLLEAGEAYWDWSQAYAKLKVLDNAVLIAAERFDAVKRSARLGEAAPVDTLEAGLQVQIRQVELQQAQLDYNNATAALSVFLWSDGIIPLEVGKDMVPVSERGLIPNPLEDFYLNNLDSLLMEHPELRETQFKIDGLQVDRRLKKEDLKPLVNLNYTPITENVGGDPFADLSAQNMKWGVTFEMPLLLRKARAGVQLADIKVKNAELQLENKGLMLYQKANIALNDWQTTFDQSTQFERTVRDYFRLYQAERRKFQLGESNLFLVNSRENKYVDSQIKQIEFLIKNQKSILKTEYALGILAQEIGLLYGG